MSEKLVALYRVSTALKQGADGLGIQSQIAAVEAYRQATGGEIIASYTETESGMHDDINQRPMLLRAISHAKRSKGILTIARLDRLIRSTIVMSELKKSRVRFVACDLVNANEFTIDIHCAIAAETGRKIGLTTRAALAAYRDNRRVSKRIKAQYGGVVPQEVVDALGGKLGASLEQCRNLTQDAREKGARLAGRTHKLQADEAYADIAPWMAELRQAGLSLAGICERLSAEGHTTRHGKPWNPMQVKRVLDRGLHAACVH